MLKASGMRNSNIYANAKTRKNHAVSLKHTHSQAQKLHDRVQCTGQQFVRGFYTIKTLRIQQKSDSEFSFKGTVPRKISGQKYSKFCNRLRL
jgi:hypothetical protein